MNQWPLILLNELRLRSISTECTSTRTIPVSSSHSGSTISEHGTNLRHTPEICLPSGGWTKIESQSKVLSVHAPRQKSVQITRLGYGRGELVEHVGFWYYIFGEGKLENFVRQLPITSRSSHGRTTRGSSMTVEIFYPGDHDSDGEALCDFAQPLLDALEPILPLDRAAYHVP